MRLRIKSYSPCDVPGYTHLPTIHITGETLGSAIPTRKIHGTVSMIGDGSVRWTTVRAHKGPLMRTGSLNVVDCLHSTPPWRVVTRTNGCRRVSRSEVLRLRWACWACGLARSMSAWTRSVSSCTSVFVWTGLLTALRVRSLLGVEGWLRLSASSVVSLLGYPYPPP